MRNFFLEVNTTHACTLRCSYCIEQDSEYHKMKYDMTNFSEFVNFINNLFNSEWFINSFDTLSIGFWGGEPTLNHDFIRKCFNEFKDNDRVWFFIYSNGYTSFNTLKEDFIEISKYKIISKEPKLFIQISYDGQPIHDMNRKNIAGNPSSDIVLETINWLVENKISYSLKSTLKLTDLKYLYESYKDVKSLHTKYWQFNENKNTTYFPTLDYFTIYNEIIDFDQIYTDLKENLIKIAKEEIEYYKKHKKFFFAWFEDNRRLCSAGTNNMCIDLNNDVYVCHGALYSINKQDHLFGNLRDDNFINKLENIINQRKTMINETCKNCFATYCLRCNITKYDLSNKTEYVERWNDYQTQPLLCELYKLVSKVRISMDSYCK